MLWIKKGLNKKGLALPMVFLMAVVFIPMAVGLVFLLRQETKIVRKSKVSAQAEQLAEGAANRGLIELKKRINEDLRENLDTRGYSPWDIENFKDHPMNFIHDCLVLSTSIDFFDIWTTSATLNFSEDLETGSYNTEVAIWTTRAPGWEPHGGGLNNPVVHFYFRYKITTGSTVKYEGEVGEPSAVYETSTMMVDSLSPNAVRPDGEFEIRIGRPSFSRYNLFCESLQNNNWFTRRYDFAGPVHFNDELNFYGDPGNNGLSGTFNDILSCTAATANFFHGGHLPADFYDNGNGIADAGDDRPVFNAGFQRGVDRIDMPVAGDAQMQAQQTTALGLDVGSAIPACADGVYVPNDGSDVTGGIYIQGDVDNMTMSTAGGGNRAVYTIDHSNGTTYTIDVNMQSGRTRFNDGSPHNYSGTTNGVIFTNGGDIDAFSGTVQEDSQLTVAATGEITITNHVQYADDPVGNPAATNVLGLLSWNDDIMIGTSAPNNLTVQASVMTPVGIFEVENYDSCGIRGDLNLLGGVIGDEMGYHGMFDSSTGICTDGYSDQYIYDVRFREMVPPMFPAINGGVFQSDVLDFNTAPSWRRE